MLSMALLLVTLGCSEPVTSERGQDLLKRTPSEWIREFDELKPTAEKQWGEFGLSGWKGRTQKRANGDLYVESASDQCSLALPIVDVRDRRIELKMWSVNRRAGATKQSHVIVRLNGELVLARIELSGSPKLYPLDVASEGWRIGNNQLSFEFERGALGKADAKSSLAVGGVSYGTKRLPRYDAQAEVLRLANGTGLRVNLELLGKSNVKLAGKSQGRGTVTLSARIMNPRTGLVQSKARARSLEIGDDEFELELPLKRSQDELVQLELLWSANSEESELIVTAMDLHEERAARRPPVIFISIDTLSARNMSLHGYQRNTTPNLEAFSRDAIVFENARANAPYTVQSYMSQFTGLYPPANRLTADADEADSPYTIHNQIASNRWTMAEMLRAAGYETAAWIDNPWLARDMGWEQGFDLYDKSAASPPNQIQNPLGGIHRVAELAEAWIGSLGDGVPFFAFLQILDPHGPYLPSGEFMRQFEADAFYERRMLPTGDNQLHAFGVVPEYVARSLIPEGNLPAEIDAGKLVAAYDAKIAETDERLGRFFDYLRKAGLYDSALIILSADHGESLTTHDYFFDHGTMYDEVLGVPLAIHLPGGVHGGTRRSDNVQLVDLIPTIAEVVELPQRMQGHGRSLLHEPSTNTIAVFSESGIMKQASVVKSDWKLIQFEPLDSSLSTQLSHPRVDRKWLRETFAWYTETLRTNRETLDYLEAHLELKQAVERGLVAQLQGPIEELYNLAEDPLELNELSKSHPLELSRMRGVMEREAERAEEAREYAAGAVPSVLELDAVKQLGDLGYFGDPDENDEDK
ncbi:MAG: arylsulfatase A-like enzyme [Planctomycetota bacterium]|jgi:arylsulfatase A-like enzyme